MIRDKNIYMLKKFNRLYLSNIFIDNKLKKFYFWQWFYLNLALNLNYAELSNLKDFFLSNGNGNFFDVLDNIFNL